MPTNIQPPGKLAPTTRPCGYGLATRSQRLPGVSVEAAKRGTARTRELGRPRRARAPVRRRSRPAGRVGAERYKLLNKAGSVVLRLIWWQR
jgi:hypothetical protein